MFGWKKRHDTLMDQFRGLQECLAVVKGQRDESQMDNQELTAICEKEHKVSLERGRNLDSVKAHNQDLTKQVSALKQENDRLKLESQAVVERMANADRNRRWIDAATNYLGPATADWAATLHGLAEELDLISEAYHKPDAEYPWSENV